MAYETIDNSSNGAMLPNVEKSENSRHVTRCLKKLSMDSNLQKMSRCLLKFVFVLVKLRDCKLNPATPEGEQIRV
jgi:hypothetical protein